MNNIYDSYRIKKNAPKLGEMMTKNNCGFSHQVGHGKSGVAKWCRLDSERGSCCLNDKCVDTEICKKRTDLAWNSVGFGEYKMDLGRLKEGEACEWLVGNRESAVKSDNTLVSQFETFSPDEVVKILSGKTLVFVGDSHARGMFVALIQWLKSDFSFHDDFKKSGKLHKFCPGGYDLTYNLDCVMIIENRFKPPRNKKVLKRKRQNLKRRKAAKKTKTLKNAKNEWPESVVDENENFKLESAETDLTENGSATSEFATYEDQILEKPISVSDELQTGSAKGSYRMLKTDVNE